MLFHLISVTKETYNNNQYNMTNTYLLFKVFIAIILISFSNNNLKAQETPIIDSLKTRINKENNDSLLAGLHADLAYHYRIISIDSLITHAKKRKNPYFTGTSWWYKWQFSSIENAYKNEPVFKRINTGKIRRNDKSDICRSSRNIA